ncbi:MAG: TonB-dependent receptor plug, partial [Rhizorhabdus sp.]|nr:TonB-dependent receptor plug [Rhizorhabdus sp.]
SIDYNDLVNRYDLSLDGRYDGLFHTKLVIGHLQDIIKPGPRDTVRATIEYRRNQMTQKPDLSGRAGYDVYSGGMMWDHHFSDAVTANLAGRIEHVNLGQSGAIDPLIPFTGTDFDRDFTAWSANAGLVIKPDSLSAVRIQVARGVQIPSLIAFGVALRAPIVPGVFAGFVGNPGLNPTVAESGEIGFSRSFGADTSFNITAFYSRATNILTLDQSPPTPLPGLGLLIQAIFNAGGHSESYGVESTLKGMIGQRLNWQIDYTYNAIAQAFAPSLPETNQPFRDLTPRHKVGARLGYDDGRFTIDGRALLRSHVIFPLNGRESGWTLGLDAHAGWTLTSHMQLFATAENLTGAHYIDNGRLRQDVRGRIGMGLGF